MNIANKKLNAGLPKPKMLIPTNEDPHDYHPPMSLVKKMHMHPILVVPPVGLQRWLKSILKARKGRSLTTLVMPSVTINNKKKLSEESLSHFWLDTETYCDAYIKTANFIKSTWPKKVSDKKFSCPVQDLTDRFQAFFDRNNAPFILNHAALVPLMEAFSVQYLVLNSSGHHSSINPSVIKKANKIFSKNPVVYWINESQSEPPKAISKMVRSSDKVIKVDTLGRIGEKSSPLEVLIALLEQSQKQR